jgi:hypothetical protein
MNFVLFAMGLLFMVIGIAVGKFKFYWLISGYNTAHEKAKKNVDIEKVGRLFAVVCYINSAILFIGFGASYFIQVPLWIFLIIIYGMFIWMVLYSTKYDKDKGDKGEAIATAIIVGIVVIIIAVCVAYI